MKPSDERERLQEMRDDIDGHDWIFSDFDRAAIRWALAEIDGADERCEELVALAGVEVATLKARLFTAEQANDLTRSMNARLNAELKACEAEPHRPRVVVVEAAPMPDPLPRPGTWTRTLPTEPGWYWLLFDEGGCSAYEVFELEGMDSLWCMPYEIAQPVELLPVRWWPVPIVPPTIPAPEPSP